ncbi:MAG: hypothetical protein U1C74_21095 [Phenylobacterium sp.]|nr:hypothetical protein [Phenylobacterium sp.]
MKTAVAMGVALALFGTTAWSASVEAPNPASSEMMLSAPEATLPGDEAGDPFAAREKATDADGPLAVLGLSKSSPLPDPASWAMMIVGFFGAGYLLRSGRSGGMRILREAKAARAVAKRDATTR